MSWRHGVVQYHREQDSKQKTGSAEDKEEEVPWTCTEGSDPPHGKRESPTDVDTCPPARASSAEV